MENKSLSQFPLAIKVLCACYILSNLLSYGVALLQVYDRSHYDMDKTITYYRGDEDPDSMMLPQSFTSILSITHVHSFSQPVMLVLLGGIFVFTKKSQKAKSTLIILAFLGLLLSNATPWLIRYAAGGFVYLYPISQTMVAAGILSMSYFSLKEIFGCARS